MWMVRRFRAQTLCYTACSAPSPKRNCAISVLDGGPVARERQRNLWPTLTQAEMGAGEALAAR